jgi:hypothetical protein
MVVVVVMVVMRVVPLAMPGMASLMVTMMMAA